jgi:hypothetical protein
VLLVSVSNCDFLGVICVGSSKDILTSFWTSAGKCVIGHAPESSPASFWMSFPEDNCNTPVPYWEDKKKLT